MLRVDHARWDQTPADLRELAMSASHPRTRERFLALYEITQESCATRVAAQARRHPQTVMEWLHLYNTPEALAYQRTGPPLCSEIEAGLGETIRAAQRSASAPPVAGADPPPRCAVWPAGWASGSAGPAAGRRSAPPCIVWDCRGRRPKSCSAGPIRSAGMSSGSRISWLVPSTTAISWSTWTKPTSIRTPTSAT